MWARLESAENTILKSSGVILNTEGSERKTADGDNDIEFFDEDITHLYNNFEVPLHNASLACSLHDTLEEWHNLIEYTNSYLNPTTLPYLRVWYKIFNSSRRNEWNFILLLKG